MASRLTGWGVEVQFPGRRKWWLLVRPGKDRPLCTHLEGAQYWADDYRRRGCKVRLVEIEQARGPAYREKAPSAPPGPALPFPV